MTSDFRCNLCREGQSEFVWVTQCSHLFCDVCGSKAFQHRFGVPPFANEVRERDGEHDGLELAVDDPFGVSSLSTTKPTLSQSASSYQLPQHSHSNLSQTNFLLWGSNNKLTSNRHHAHHSQQSQPQLHLNFGNQGDATNYGDNSSSKKKNYNSSSCRCPLCDAVLAGPQSVLQVESNPPEEIRSMGLVGLMPEVIMEIASRGLSFYSFQMSLEAHFAQQETKARMTKLEDAYQSLSMKSQADLDRLQLQIKATHKENTKLISEVNALKTSLAEKSRQHQRLQSLYDGLRRKLVTSQSPPQHQRQQRLHKNTAFHSNSSSSSYSQPQQHQQQARQMDYYDGAMMTKARKPQATAATATQNNNSRGYTMEQALDRFDGNDASNPRRKSKISKQKRPSPHHYKHHQQKREKGGGGLKTSVSNDGWVLRYSALQGAKNEATPPNETDTR
eukprot:m.33733 g.33733  ORF g.33733 m.33733 type:complete len:446 (+) comp9878_c1_seq2:120-1457(+)